METTTDSLPPSTPVPHSSSVTIPIHHSTTDDSKEEEVDIPLVGDFFICRDYETKYFTFTSSIPNATPVTQPLDCLVAASTDFDLTGQIVWPAARLTSYYITYLGQQGKIEKNTPTTMNDNFWYKNILELGAGTGLCGLIASQFSNSSSNSSSTDTSSSSSPTSVVCLSDNEPEVLTILQRNLVHSGTHSHTFVQDLDWGNIEHYRNLSQYIYKVQPYQCTASSSSSSSSIDNHATTSSNSSSPFSSSTAITTPSFTPSSSSLPIYRWPVIIGADIVYWSSAIVPLIHAVTSLLAKDGVFILGYFNRLSTNQDLLETEAKKNGLIFQIIPHSTYLPFNTDTHSYPPDVEASLTKMWIYRFTWAS